jgi:hypothetical protein
LDFPDKKEAKRQLRPFLSSPVSFHACIVGLLSSSNTVNMAASTLDDHRSDRLSGDKTEVESPRNGTINEKQVDEVTPDAPASQTQDETDDNPDYPSGLKLILIIFALLMSVFLVALDQTIIAPALGAITSEYKSVKDIVSQISFLIHCHGRKKTGLTLFRFRKYRDGMALRTCSPPRPCSPCTEPFTSSSTLSLPISRPSSSSRLEV